MPEGFLPPFPPEQARLQRYLQRRDLGPPTAGPVPGLLVQRAPVAGFTLDTISWAYAQPTGDDVLRADGFLVFVECLDTATPAGAIWAVALEARRFEMLWPDGTTRSYAVASYRTTYADQERSAPMQDPTWKGATS